ncbi:hypothetical protein XAUC_00770 [Xanthomonas citri pv. aurantifolii str. ICPB 10535]|nr:hypothetical protein XAUC_00770 [Xanthomonas citri pv. aurantifolii str. ICPB 10535]
MLSQASGPIVDASNTIVSFARRISAAYLDGTEPSTRVVGVIGDDAVGILSRQRVASTIISKIFSDTPKAISDLPQIALAVGADSRHKSTAGIVAEVVAVIRAVCDIFARANAGQQQASQRTCACRDIRIFTVALCRDPSCTASGIDLRSGQGLASGVIGPLLPLDQFALFGQRVSKRQTRVGINLVT